MGQHKVVGGSVNKRPNQTEGRRWKKPALCLVCGGPNAKFIVDGKERYRLAKTIIRITQKNGDQGQVYVHENPCLNTLVQNWARYVVRNDGLKTLGNPGVLQIRED